MKKNTKANLKFDEYIMTHEEIANHLHLSRSRVEQIEKEALRKLRNSKLMEYVR